MAIRCVAGLHIFNVLELRKVSQKQSWRMTDGEGYVFQRRAPPWKRTTREEHLGQGDLAEALVLSPRKEKTIASIGHGAS